MFLLSLGTVDVRLWSAIPVSLSRGGGGGGGVLPYLT